MTTDVINGVPRSLLRLLADSAEHGYGIDNENLEVARALLATAQPAADGEREAFEAWLATVMPISKHTFSRSQDGEYAYNPAHEWWKVWQARAAQPQQAVAVMDEVNRLREALERDTGYRDGLAAGFSFGVSDDLAGYQRSLSCYAQAVREGRATLAAHKTGEEE